MIFPQALMSKGRSGDCNSGLSGPTHPTAAHASSILVTRSMKTPGHAEDDVSLFSIAPCMSIFHCLPGRGAPSTYHAPGSARWETSS